MATSHHTVILESRRVQALAWRRDTYAGSHAVLLSGHQK